MKNNIKRIFFCAMMLAVMSAHVYSQTTVKAIQDAVNIFSNDVAKAIPFNSTIGLNWSDAYIGQLIGTPPHFGLGVTAGFTTMGIESIDKVLEAAGSSGDVIPSFLRKTGMPIPAYTVEGRLGGFLLPFDLGFKFGILPLERKEISIDYMLLGFDFRYAVIKSKASPIKLSIGAGYNFLKGGVGVNIGDTAVYQFPVGSNTYSLNLQDPKLNFKWDTHTIELKTQISFKMPVITPYAGFGASMAFSKAGYKFDTKLTVRDNTNAIVPVDNQPVQNALNVLGVTGVTGSGFESINKHTTYNMRVYGGISLNMAALKFDLTGMYNILGKNWGGTLGIRFQL